MPVSLHLTGTAAIVEWGYHLAADLGAWEIRDWCLRADIRTSHPVYLTKAPLLFTVDSTVSGKPLQRQLLEAHAAGGVLTGRLVPRKG